MSSKKSIICKNGIVKSEDGKDKLYDLVYWNAVQLCNPDSCACISLCPSQEIGTPCGIISNYMRNVYEVMIRTYKGTMTEDVAYRIGMHLVPLYKNLCRLKMQEFAETETMIYDSHGSRKINPIFEEIRKTILDIEKVWKNLGYIVEDKKEKINLQEHLTRGTITKLLRLAASPC